MHTFMIILGLHGHGKGEKLEGFFYPTPSTSSSIWSMFQKNAQNELYVRLYCISVSNIYPIHLGIRRFVFEKSAIDHGRLKFLILIFDPFTESGPSTEPPSKAVNIGISKNKTQENLLNICQNLMIPQNMTLF